MVVLQNIVLKLFKVLFKSQKFLFVCQISLNIQKSLLFYKIYTWVGVKLTLCDNSDDLKIIFSLVFFNLNVAKLKKLEASLINK